MSPLTRLIALVDLGVVVGDDDEGLPKGLVQARADLGHYRLDLGIVKIGRQGPDSLNVEQGFGATIGGLRWRSQTKAWPRLIAYDLSPATLVRGPIPGGKHLEDSNSHL